MRPASVEPVNMKPGERGVDGVVAEGDDGGSERGTGGIGFSITGGGVGSLCWCAEGSEGGSGMGSIGVGVLLDSVIIVIKGGVAGAGVAGLDMVSILSGTMSGGADITSAGGSIGGGGNDIGIGPSPFVRPKPDPNPFNFSPSTTGAKV